VDRFGTTWTALCCWSARCAVERFYELGRDHPLSWCHNRVARSRETRRPRLHRIGFSMPSTVSPRGTGGRWFVSAARCSQLCALNGWLESLGSSVDGLDGVAAVACELASKIRVGVVLVCSGRSGFALRAVGAMERSRYDSRALVEALDLGERARRWVRRHPLIHLPICSAG